MEPIGPWAARSAFARQRGFTLVEVLVVVLLVAISLSFVVVRLEPDEREIVRGEAGRLALGIQQAQDEVLMTGSLIAWRVEGEGYRYLRRTGDRVWVRIDGDDAFRPRRLPAPVRLLDVDVGGMKIPRGAPVILSPSALAVVPVRIVLGGENERAAVEVGTTTRVVLFGGS